MGTGVHGGFGNTRGKRESKFFVPVLYEGTVKVGGVERNVSRRVYQRHDIDFDRVDQDSGLTNLQLMKLGNAPIGNDGNPIQLHHVLQKESGSMVEVREVTHKEYHRILHGLIENGNSFRHDEDLKRQYDNLKKKYWRWQAKQILKDRNK